jgi:hypothetical protein
MTPDWRHWWTTPVLIFSGITGPGGWRYLLDDPALMTVMPAPLYFALLAVVLVALGICAGAAVLAVLWAFDQTVEVWAEKQAQLDADIAALQALPRRDEVSA